MKNWHGQEIETAVSKGGVIALANPYDNLIKTGVDPWPPSEVVQKLYQSRQARAFLAEQKEIIFKYNGYYSDLQSIHSEDAITWSIFGTVARDPRKTRNAFITELFQAIEVKSKPIHSSEIFLWRRIPHPDTLVSGGPEIDFGILTEDTLLLGESKWKSAVGNAQGKHKDKDQIQLRIEFLRKYAPKLYPEVEQFIVLVLGLKSDILEAYLENGIKCISTTWDDVCALKTHPNHDELLEYLNWKTINTKKG